MEEHILDLCNDLLKLLRMGIYLARTYPQGHPSMVHTTQRLCKLFNELRIEKRVISLVVIESIITIEDERFDSQKISTVKYLIDRFHQLGIKSVTFNTEVSEGDLKEFFSVMALSTAEVEDYGDIVAIMRMRDITGVKVNIYRVGVVSSDEDVRELDWENFLESLITAESPKNEEERLKELGNFLGVLGVSSDDSTEIQSNKIVAGMEKLALMVVDRYGEERWNEYSLVFSRILAILSPSVKKNVVRYRTENKKLAELFRKIVPTMNDEDIVDIVVTIAKTKTPDSEDEIVDVLSKVSSIQLPSILSTLRQRAPEFYTHKFVDRLMSQVKSRSGPEAATKFVIKNLELEMKSHFPALRSSSAEVRIKAIEALISFADKLFDAKNYDLVRLIVNRLDTMAEAESEFTVFAKAVDAMKILYIKARDRKVSEVMEFIAKKFAKYLMRKDSIFLERKRVVIKAIGETRDPTYIPELISSLWAAGTYGEAREALIGLADHSAPLLLQNLRETEDYSVRMKILDIFKRMSERVIPIVAGLLKADEWYARRNGVFILGELKAETVIDDIAALLKEDIEQIQIEVVMSLNKIGGPESIEHIKKALNSEYQSVTLEAMKYLNPEDFKSKIPEVLNWLKRSNRFPDATEEKFRSSVIEVLGKCKDELVIKALNAVVKEHAWLRGNLLLPTKAAALNALSQIGTPDAMQILQKAANSRNQTIALSAQDVLQRLTTKSEEEQD
ncbi:MAG: HEAT repeat domain-containing protein [bacterium]